MLELELKEILKIITDLGFPIAACIVAVYFVFITIKYILMNVTISVQAINNELIAKKEMITEAKRDFSNISSALDVLFRLR